MAPSRMGRLALFAACSGVLLGQANEPTASTRITIQGLVSRSFPDLASATIRIVPFQSRTDFFRSRFLFLDFFTRRTLRYQISVNRQLEALAAPPPAREAILAHELAHIRYYGTRSRWRLLGLVRLLSEECSARFERDADRAAIQLGYGPGLIVFREWLYGVIPPRAVPHKKKVYLTPDEIRAICCPPGSSKP